MSKTEPEQATKDEERRRQAAEPEQPKTEDRRAAGLRSQGAVDAVAATKPPFVRVYRKAPNLDRPFDAVDMDEKVTKDAAKIPTAKAPNQPPAAEKTTMPPDTPAAVPATAPKEAPSNRKQAASDKGVQAAKMASREAEKPAVKTEEPADADRPKQAVAEEATTDIEADERSDKEAT